MRSKPFPWVQTIRIWRVYHVALRMPMQPGEWADVKRFVRRALFVRWLIQTGRLNGPTSYPSSRSH